MNKKRRKSRNRVASNNIKSKPIKTQNAMLTGIDGAGGCGNSSLYEQYVNQIQNTIQKWREYVTIYYTEPFTKKAVDIPVDDMLKKHWKYANLTDEEIQAMLTLEKKLHLHEYLSEALKQERVIGGCAILIGVADGKELDAPLIVEDIPKNGQIWLKKLLIMNRIGERRRSLKD